MKVGYRENVFFFNAENFAGFKIDWLASNIKLQYSATDSMIYTSRRNWEKKDIKNMV